MKKILILALFFYFLVISQTSFLIHFDIFWSGFLAPSLILITAVFLNFFESSKETSGLFIAFIGGFFLDIFSGEFLGINFFGLWILISIITSLFIKFILKKYVRLSFKRL